MKDFGLVDLPFPLRKLGVTPVGTLKGTRDGKYHLERGIGEHPSVGDAVLLPTHEQLRSVIEPTGTNRRVELGSSVLDKGARVAVDPDKLLGRHVAVLGNTGSGKSCTVASVIRKCVLAAKDAGRTPNARIVVLDPNGEYGSAFKGMGMPLRVFRASTAGEEKPLTMPAWIWNSAEWCAFAQASPGVQRPMLLQALRDMRTANRIPDDPQQAVYQLLRSYEVRLRAKRNEGTAAFQEFKGQQSVGEMLSCIAADCVAALEKLPNPGPSYDAVTALLENTKALCAARKPGKWFSAFADADLAKVITDIESSLTTLPEPPALGSGNEDAPIPFAVDELADHLERLAQSEGGGQAAQFVSTLVMRIRMMIADQRLGPIVAPSNEPSFVEWLDMYLAGDDSDSGCITIIDLSLVPSEVTHMVVAVFGRVIFEASQRYRRSNDEVLPTLLVLEEAHTFVQRTRADSADAENSASMCRETFERIAREGRKFGLGLLLSSQRPSELSATVLAQCNSFLLHRLVNDRDRQLVERLVPDSLSDLLKELPSLPVRHAVLLGWATPVPVLLSVDELVPEHRPHSADPDFWDVWSRAACRPAEWGVIASEWVDGSNAE